MASREIASSDDEPAAPRKGFKPTPEAPYRVVTPDVKDETRPPSPPPETPPAKPKRPQPIKARSPVDNFLAWLSPRSSRESKWMQPLTAAKTGEKLALKVLLRDVATSPGERRCFAREAQLLARMAHPNVCETMGCSTTPGGLPCLLLTWCASDVLRSLKLNDVADPETRHKVAKAWPAAERLRLVAELFGALAYLHSGDALRGVAVVHRDVKPENLGLTDARRLKLLDFGLAVALEKEDAAAFELTGDTGSRRYMAPEVAKQRPYAAPVDVYSAAIVSAEVLGLHRAFAGLSLEDHERRVIDGGLRPRLQASPRLQALFAALWDGDAGKRRDAASARDELAAVVAADSDPSGRRRAARASSPRRPPRRASS
ncbi:protein kinase [Aureococcus anophagefferens]|nr:protein kinase [Aureococcus anophagefferens]